MTTQDIWRTRRRSSGFFLLVPLLLILLESLFLPVIHGLSLVPLPPWRGLRQVLSVGPWGVLWDARRSVGEVLYVESGENGHSSRLIPMEELPPVTSETHARIVAISDTHGKHRQVKLPACTVLCHCGDILQRYGYWDNEGGGSRVLQDFAMWLQEVPAVHQVVIGGNHDIYMERIGKERVQQILTFPRGRYAAENPNVFYLQNELVKVANMTIYGSPWSPRGVTGNTAFQQGKRAKQAVKLALSQLSHPSTSKIDVLLTHASCRQWESLLATGQTQFWAHGHWHDGQGRLTTHRTWVGSGRRASSCASINVASNDMVYRPKNPPVVYDIALSTRYGNPN